VGIPQGRLPTSFRRHSAKNCFKKNKKSLPSASTWALIKVIFQKNKKQLYRMPDAGHSPKFFQKNIKKHFAECLGWWHSAKFKNFFAECWVGTQQNNL